MNSSKPDRSISLVVADRERRLWLCALAAVVAIYSTLGLAGRLVQMLPAREQLDAAYILAFALAIAAVVAGTLFKHSRWREIWVTLCLIVAYGMVGVRMGIGPEERTHLFEYGLVAFLIHQAFSEGARKGRRVPVPALLAIVSTALLGWIDEGIQALLPNRVYDVRDVGVNALAALMAVVASTTLAWLRSSNRIHK
ncbi:MAG: hypothetical protein CME06_16830 [Gemmatimonadetes bacterium]|nr:hypothetical protein [Gemmatimonadota bacterium]